MTTQVVEYWPEFGRHGKEVLTVADYLSHRAGLAAIDRDRQITRDHIRDPVAMSALLEDQVGPGTSVGRAEKAEVRLCVSFSLM